MHYTWIDYMVQILYILYWSLFTDIWLVWPFISTFGEMSYLEVLDFHS